MLFCWLGPLFYHGDTTVSNLLNANSAPAPGAPLGTDTNGFDVLGR